MLSQFALQINAQARYDVDPRSRSEHIECVSTYRTHKRISKIRDSGFISMRSVLKGTTLKSAIFLFNYILLSDNFRINSVISFPVRVSSSKNSLDVIREIPE